MNLTKPAEHSTSNFERSTLKVERWTFTWFRETAPAAPYRNINFTFSGSCVGGWQAIPVQR
jgi:hypothetical protein